MFKFGKIQSLLFDIGKTAINNEIAPHLHSWEFKEVILWTTYWCRDGAENQQQLNRFAGLIRNF